VAFYHGQVLFEALPGDLQGLQLDFGRGYHEEVAEASRIYKSAIKSSKIAG
jgi:hypothetical protein